MPNPYENAWLHSAACPNCASSQQRRTSTIERFNEFGINEETQMPAIACAGCGETLWYSVGRDANLARAAWVAEAGMRTGGGFRIMRRSLGLSGRALGKLFDVRVATISDWENDKSPVSVTAWAALGAMVRDRMGLRQWTADSLTAPLTADYPKGVLKLVAPMRLNSLWELESDEAGQTPKLRRAQRNVRASKSRRPARR